jgi:hypothetical protein
MPSVGFFILRTYAENSAIKNENEKIRKTFYRFTVQKALDFSRLFF